MRQRSAVIGPNENSDAARPARRGSRSLPPECHGRRSSCGRLSDSALRLRPGRQIAPQRPDDPQTATVGGPGLCCRPKATIRAFPRAATLDRRPFGGRVAAI